MDWKDIDTTHCGVAACAELIGDYWSILILRDILAGVTKFGDLQKHTGVSTAVLSKRLKHLVEADILEAIEYKRSGLRARIEYTITKRGLNLVPVIVAMGQFGYDQLIAPADRLVEYLDSQTKQHLRVGFLREDGQEVELQNLSLRITPNAYVPEYQALPSRKRPKG
jgi:DNA-binding HxlR family transcriptional regulator